MKNLANHATIAIKKYCVLFIIFFFTFNNLLGEIKNGYENEIFSTREALKNLSALLAEEKDLSIPKRRKIESKIEWLVSNITYYQLTENLLNQFRLIAPILYNEIDTIKDSRGRVVNVYVKFIPTDATVVKAWGTTYMSQGDNDQDAYSSEYGEFTVSIKIWIVNNALLVLSHELGHVKYQVPNLASYFKYYKIKYYNIMNTSNDIGHDPNDPSGKSAIQCEKIFRKEYAYFLKTTNEKFPNPVALVENIRKNFTENKTNLLGYVSQLR